MANKWVPDSDGVFRCPECDFETRGNGLVIGAHIRAQHKELWQLIRREGAETVMQAAREARERNGKRHRVPRQLELVQPRTTPHEVIDDMVTDVAALTRPRISAARAAISVLNLPEVMGLNSAQLRELLEHVVAIRKLDEQPDLVEGTGFSSENISRVLEQKAAGNGRRELQEVH